MAVEQQASKKEATTIHVPPAAVDRSSLLLVCQTGKWRRAASGTGRCGAKGPAHVHTPTNIWKRESGRVACVCLVAVGSSYRSGCLSLWLAFLSLPCSLSATATFTSTCHAAGRCRRMQTPCLCGHVRGRSAAWGPGRSVRTTTIPVLSYHIPIPIPTDRWQDVWDEAIIRYYWRIDGTETGRGLACLLACVPNN